MMKFRPLYSKLLIVIGIDAALITASIYGAYLVRFEFSIPSQYLVLLYTSTASQSGRIGGHHLRDNTQLEYKSDKTMYVA